MEFRPAQTCCGQPLFDSGQWDDAREAAIPVSSATSGGLAFSILPHVHVVEAYVGQVVADLG